MDKFSAIPERDQVDEEFKWRLQDIYKNEQDWEADRQAVTDLLSGFQGYEGRLGESAKTLLAVLTRRKQIEQFSDKLFAYARMHRDENAANTKYQAMTGKIQSLMAKAAAAYAFIEPELLTIPAAKLKEFLTQEPELSEYQFYFANLLRQKDHILSPQEEAMLSRLAEVTQASAETFQMLARADMKFPNVVNQDGSKLPLSEGRYHSFIISPDRFLRQQAFKKLLGTYRSYRNTFATTLGGNIKQDLFYAKTRGYDSQLAAALTPDNIPLSLYDQLIKTVNQYLPSLHRYVEIKKRALKLPEIHMYDLYTPLVADIKLSYSYPEALALVEKALAPLGENYLAELKRGFESGWIDVYENRGKQTGAYSWGVYGVHPFVLLNFNGRYEDVSTLAHEMGHALHSFFSHTTQPYATSSYTIFCAEVASTTNEILLMDHMLKTVSDQKIRLYLINQLLETIRGTVYRQTLFAEFEKAAYTFAESGESMTADWLDQLWHNLNIKYYGSRIVVDRENDVEWARIPHFYRSFYVYKYATGYSAATALAHKIETEGEPAQNRYLQFLRSGGSDYSLELLSKAGVDMTGPAPVEQTLTKFTDLLNQVEENLL